MLKPIHNTNRWVFDGLQVLGVNRQAVIYNRFSAEMTSVKPVVAAGLMMVFKHQLHSHWTQSSSDSGTVLPRSGTWATGQCSSSLSRHRDQVRKRERSHTQRNSQADWLAQRIIYTSKTQTYRHRHNQVPKQTYTISACCLSRDYWLQHWDWFPNVEIQDWLKWSRISRSQMQQKPHTDKTERDQLTDQCQPQAWEMWALHLHGITKELLCDTAIFHYSVSIPYN